ncbi:hypothetical protein [Tunturiibacter gelidiferens]
MLPQLGSSATCAGSATLVPSGTTTDQRGFPWSPPVWMRGGAD